MDLPNETESLGSVFDRLENSYEDGQEAYEAFVTEFEQGRYAGERSDGVADEGPYWDEDRAATQRRLDAEDVHEPRYDGTAIQSRQEAREAQAESWEEEHDDESPAGDEDHTGDGDQTADPS